MVVVALAVATTLAAEKLMNQMADGLSGRRVRFQARGGAGGPRVRDVPPRILPTRAHLQVQVGHQLAATMVRVSSPKSPE